MREEVLLLMLYRRFGIGTVVQVDFALVDRIGTELSSLGLIEKVCSLSALDSSSSFG